jgi:hypothetical protein
MDKIKNTIKEVFSGERNKLTHTGKLVIKRTKGKEWGMIEVDKKLWKKRRDKLILLPANWDIPPYDPHISVFSREEVRKIPENFPFEGKEITFTLRDNLRVLDPQSWNEVYECAFEIVDCFEIQKIRMDLGFTPYMNNNHEFHLTLGIKYKKKQ